MIDCIKKHSYKMEITIYTFILFLISSCVFLNGDDFMYGTFAKEGIISNVLSYYFTGNGRFIINILDSFLLYFDKYLFAVINPLVIMTFIILLAKNAQYIIDKEENKQREITFIRYGMILFACIDVMCLREVAFWITGMMNYLFPATTFLLGILKFQKIRRNCKLTKLNAILFIFLCFFASFAVEQYSLMFVGFMTLLIISDYINKRKINKIILYGYFVSIIGLGFLILAPANFVRVDNQLEEMPSFLVNLWSLVYQDTMSHVAFPLLLPLTILTGKIFIDKSKNKISRYFVNILLILMIVIRMFPIFDRAFVISLVLIFVFIILMKVLLFENFDYKEELLSLIFIGFGSQIMLLISAIWGYRCMFSLYVIYMLLILMLISHLKQENQISILMIAILSSINATLVVLYIVLCKIIKDVNIKNYKLLNVIALLSLSNIFVGYYLNISTYKENINETLNAKSLAIDLCELPNEKFSWYSLPMNEFHENYYKKYYDVNESTSINYITNEVK